MKQEVTIPEVGESVTQGTLTAWLKKDGEFVTSGEDLFELETDKATLAVPSPDSGVLSIEVEAGSEVNVGQVVATLKPGEKPENTGTLLKGDQVQVKEQKTLSPSVLRVVTGYNMEPNTIRGTGKDGRITKKDVLQEVEQRQKNAVEAEPEAVKTTIPGMTTPPDTKKEVPVAQGPVPTPSAVEIEKVAPSAPSERQTRVKMTTIRMRIAERLVESKQNAAHLTTFNEINMAEVMDIRNSYREDFEKKHGIRLGFMSFFVKACCSALAEFPEVNAMIEGDEILYNNFFDIGVAVSTDRGLLVPVVRDADRLSFAEIETKIRGFAQKAREKKLSPDELVGGTFTITNGGVFGSLLSTPIPNPPQTAILGMHAIQKRPVAVNDEIVIRPMMYVALTYDHRIIDGKQAVSFLVRIKELIEDPKRLLLDI
jgi:2-oxoglutarate dehydrogenase E2 component (dihydrolipoamide succinyltransferase)